MALVAYVSREDRRIELDPAVRAGARLDSRGEAVLLHVTGFGHCQETADHIARVLRRSGWDVDVRQVENALVDEVRSTEPGMVTRGQTAALIEAVTGEQANVPEPRKTRPRAPSARWVCTACGHPTWGAGLRSHERNREHFDFIKAPMDQIEAVQAQITRAHEQARTPEALEALLEPLRLASNGYPRLGSPEALQSTQPKEEA